MFSYFKDKVDQWKAEKERVRREAEEAGSREVWEAYHESKTMTDVSKMAGFQFEEFLARLFLQMGYTGIQLTPATDQGGDVLCVTPDGVPIVVQAKRWKGKVGNGAVQELLGAMRHYGRSKGIVVTNSSFTPAAIKLAGTSADVTLCDGTWLQAQIDRHLSPKVPPFNRERFAEIMRELVDLTREAAGPDPSPRLKELNRKDYPLLGLLRSMAIQIGRELRPEEIMDYARISRKLMRVQSQLAEIRAIKRQTREE